MTHIHRHKPKYTTVHKIDKYTPNIDDEIDNQISTSQILPMQSKSSVTLDTSRIITTVHDEDQKIIENIHID